LYFLLRSGGKMAFEWNRIHKWEENIEREVTDAVYEYVCEYYEVDDISELSEEQIAQVEGYRDHELHEFSVLQIGFSNIINNWESENI